MINSRRLRSAIQLSLASISLIFCSAATSAQGVIRFVASYGNDANNCMRTAPCRSLQAGVNATPAGAELQIIDSAGYGNNVTINKSITISAVGVTATVAAPSGNGITVAAGASDVVMLRGVTINGLGTGSFGISVTAAAAVHIDRCDVNRFSTGIVFDASGELYVTDTIVRENSSGGLVVFASNGPVQTTISDSQFINSFNGLLFGSVGANTIEASVTNSVAAGNFSSGFIVAGDFRRVNFHNCTSSGNGFGFELNGQSEMNIERSVARGNVAAGMQGTAGTIRVSNSVSTNNGTGFNQTGGMFESRANNTVQGNGVDVSGPVTTISGT